MGWIKFIKYYKSGGKDLGKHTKFKKFRNSDTATSVEVAVSEARQAIELANTFIRAEGVSPRPPAESNAKTVAGLGETDEASELLFESGIQFEVDEVDFEGELCDKCGFKHSPLAWYFKVCQLEGCKRGFSTQCKADIFCRSCREKVAKQVFEDCCRSLDRIIGGV